MNSELATLAGAEAFAQYDLNCWIAPFATIRYVDGRDHTRNGDFATKPAGPGSPSERVYGLPRGYYSPRESRDRGRLDFRGKGG